MIVFTEQEPGVLLEPLCLFFKSKKSQLSPVLQGLMGEANLNFALNKYEEAVRMCMEIIRQGTFGYIPNLFHLHQK